MSEFYYYCDKFSGLHMSGSGETELGAGESPYMKNFTVCDGYKLKKREGFKKLFKVEEGKFRGLWCGYIKDKFYILSVFGNTLYLDGEPSGTVEGDGECSFISFEKKLYILTGRKIKVFDGALFDLVPYRPLIAIGTSPAGDGTLFEGANLLTGAVRQSFSPTGTTNTFYLLLQNIDRVDYVKVSGEATDDYKADLSLGTVTINGNLSNAPDSVEIGYTKGQSDGRIEGCRYGTVYGGGNDTRVFLWGSDGYDGFRFFSEPVDGEASMEYFPENNFTVIAGGERITAIVRQYDRQIIFTPDAAYYSYADSDTRFPVYPLNSQKGCISHRFACLINNFPISLCRDGIYKWTPTSLRDERNAVKISCRIDKALPDGKDIRGFDRESTGEFYIYFDDKIYVYNYLLDVFYYYEGIGAAAFCEGDGKLYFGNSEGIFVMGGEDDNGEKIQAVWHSHYNDFSARDKKKTVFSAELDVKPSASCTLGLSYAADNVSGKQSRLWCGAGLIDFNSFDFSAFGFCTTVSAHHFKRRLHVKRCGYFKLIITNDDLAGELYIVSLAIRGKTNERN